MKVIAVCLETYVLDAGQKIISQIEDTSYEQTNLADTTTQRKKYQRVPKINKTGRQLRRQRRINYAQSEPDYQPMATLDNSVKTGKRHQAEIPDLVPLEQGLKCKKQQSLQSRRVRAGIFQ